MLHQQKQNAIETRTKGRLPLPIQFDTMDQSTTTYYFGQRRRRVVAPSNEMGKLCQDHEKSSGSTKNFVSIRSALGWLVAFAPVIGID